MSVKIQDLDSGSRQNGLLFHVIQDGIAKKVGLADLKSLHSGSGAPGGGVGIDGDFYIDVTNYDFYGPKTSGAWGSAETLSATLPQALDTDASPTFDGLTLAGDLDVEGGAVFGSGSSAAAVSIYGGTTSSDYLLNLNTRFKFRGDGALDWGDSANYGVLSWDTGVAIVGARSGKSLQLHANNTVAASISTSGVFTIDNLSGTGKRLVAATSGGGLESAGTIDGTYSFSGNIGIGASSPAKRLHVTTNTTSDPDVARFQNLGSTGDSYLDIGIGYPGMFDDYVLFRRNGTIVFGIDANSRLEIQQITQISSNKQIQSLANANNRINLSNASANFDIGYLNNLVFLSSTTEVMRVTSTGRLGIGTASPAYTLDVNGDAYFSGAMRIGELYYSPLFTLSMSVASERWVKLATIPNNHTVRFQLRTGSQNSEEMAEIKVYGTYHVSQTGITVERQTYKEHLREVRVTGTDGGLKTIYVRIRASEQAPSMKWRVVESKGSVTVHNSEETPSGGLAHLISGDRVTTMNSALTIAGLAGTGARLVTATSTGELGNATTIAGNYALSGTLDGASSTWSGALTAQSLLTTTSRIDFFTANGSNRIEIASGAFNFTISGDRSFFVGTNSIGVFGAEGAAGQVYIYADDGDDNADKWGLFAETDGTFRLNSFATGSPVAAMTVNGSTLATTFAAGVTISSAMLTLSGTGGLVVGTGNVSINSNINSVGNITSPSGTWSTGGTMQAARYGIGGTPSSASFIRITGSSTLAGTSQYGVYYDDPTFSTGATSTMILARLSGQSPNSSFATDTVIGLRVGFTKGASHTITNYYGVRVEDIPAATNGYAIHTGTGAVQLGALSGTGTRLVTATSAGLLGNATTVDAAYTWNALITAAAGIMPTGGTLNPGAIVRRSDCGLGLRGFPGSVYDFYIGANTGGADVFAIPTGTTQFLFPGSAGGAFTGPVSMSSTLSVTGALTATNLAGTGTRLVTATSAGLLENATTIAGNYSLSGTITISSLGVNGTSYFGGLVYYENSATGLPSSDSNPLVYGTSDGAGGGEPFNLNGNLVLQARSGGSTGRSIYFYSGTTPSVRYRLEPSGAHTFYGSVSLSSSTPLTLGNQLTINGLSGSGTRLVTATSTGVIGNATTISGNYVFLGAVTFSDNVQVSKSTNGDTETGIQNANTGTSARSVLRLTNDASSASIGYHSSSHATHPRDLMIANNDAAGGIKFLFNGAIGFTLQQDGYLTASSLSGTDTRLVTATSTGQLGNATTIAGSYTFSGATTIAADLTLSGASNIRLGGALIKANYDHGAIEMATSMPTAGTFISRNTADAVPTLRVKNSHSSSTGAIAAFESTAGTALTLAKDLTATFGGNVAVPAGGLTMSGNMSAIDGSFAGAVQVSGENGNDGNRFGLLVTSDISPYAYECINAPILSNLSVTGGTTSSRGALFYGEGISAAPTLENAYGVYIEELTAGSTGNFGASFANPLEFRFGTESGYGYASPTLDNAPSSQNVEYIPCRVNGVDGWLLWLPPDP